MYPKNNSLKTRNTAWMSAMLELSPVTIFFVLPAAKPFILYPYHDNV